MNYETECYVDKTHIGTRLEETTYTPVIRFVKISVNIIPTKPTPTMTTQQYRPGLPFIPLVQSNVMPDIVLPTSVPATTPSLPNQADVTILHKLNKLNMTSRCMCYMVDA